MRTATPKTPRTTVRRTAIQFWLAALLTIAFSIHTHAAEKSTAPQLIALANSNSPALQDAILDGDGREFAGSHSQKRSPGGSRFIVQDTKGLAAALRSE